MAQCEAELAVRPDGEVPVWLESNDWRLKLGAASALSRMGAPQLMGAPEIRAALESVDDANDSARQLIRTTLAASGVEGETSQEARVLQLLRSDDWRLRRGALESLQRQEPAPQNLAPALAELCVKDARTEVRTTAVGALKRQAHDKAVTALVTSLNDATAEATRASEDLREAEDLLLELLGSACDALAKVPGSTYLSGLVQKARQQENEAARWHREQEAKQQQLRDQQNELQKLQLQWLDLLPARQVLEMEQTRQTQPPVAHCQEAQARKRRARRRMRDVALADSQPQAAQNKRQGLQDYWVERSAARLKEAEDMSLQTKEDLLERSERLLEWLDEHQADSDGVSTHLRRKAAELLGSLGLLAKPEHHTALSHLLTAEDAQLRRLAVQALEKLRSSDSAAAVAKLLADSDSSVRKAAGVALAQMGGSAAGHVAQQLCNVDAEARKAAERTLLVFKIQEGEPDYKQGAMRLQALLPQLEPLLNHEYAETRSAAASVIHRLKSQAEPGRKLSNASSTTPEVVLALLSVLNDPQEETRLTAMRKLQEESPLSLQAHSAVKLAQSLADSSENVRKVAVEVVGALQEPAATAARETITELLRHKLQTIRRAAAAVMDRLGVDTPTKHLALLADEDPSVRCNACQALSKPEILNELSEGDLTSLMSLSIDPHWAVRLTVAKCLCALSPASLQKHFAHAVLLAADSDWRVVRWARKLVNVNATDGRAPRA